jgi:hypothetical protein
VPRHFTLVTWRSASGHSVVGDVLASLMNHRGTNIGYARD